MGLLPCQCWKSQRTNLILLPGDSHRSCISVLLISLSHLQNVTIGAGLVSKTILHNLKIPLNIS